MVSIEELVERMRRNPRNVKFADLYKVCEKCFGKPRSKSSSHVIFKTPWQGDPRINIQNDRGKAKVYQVKQVLRAIERLETEHGKGKRKSE